MGRHSLDADDGDLPSLDEIIERAGESHVGPDKPREVFSDHRSDAMATDLARAHADVEIAFLAAVKERLAKVSDLGELARLVEIYNAIPRANMDELGRPSSE